MAKRYARGSVVLVVEKREMTAGEAAVRNASWA